MCTSRHGASRRAGLTYSTRRVNVNFYKAAALPAAHLCDIPLALLQQQTWCRRPLEALICMYSI